MEEPETGASTGDLRENAPEAPGFTEEDDRLFRSHFQHANKLADRAYEQVRPAYQLGFDAANQAEMRGQPFEQVERDLENGWLNVRTRVGDWSSVRDYAREGYERGRALGFIGDTTAFGQSSSPDRATFSDPLADGIDPTSPESPEQTLAFQQEDRGAEPGPSADQGGFGYKSPDSSRG
jgi:hypothetical protein